MLFTYDEVKNKKNQIQITKNPFLEIIQRKVNINSFHSLIYKEMIIISILEQRLQAKIIIKNFIKSKIKI
jgi:hypothetical protein